MKIQFILIITIILIIHHPSYAAENNKLKVTYIANEGFLLESDNKKVLIDALFGKKDLNFCDTPSLETLNNITKAQTPFDDVDLLLVTHRHIDHFDAGLVTTYLENNKQCNMIGTQQAVDQMKNSNKYGNIKDRIYSITPSFGYNEKITLNGIDITTIRLKHCAYYMTDENTGEKIDRHRDMQNLGFIINLGNHKMLHIGDCGMESDEEYKHYRIYQENIDIAFLGSLFWKPFEQRIEIVNNYIKPQKIVLMHLKKNKKEAYFELKKKYQDKLAPIIIFKHERESREFIK